MGVEQEVLKSLVEVRRIDPVAHHVVESALRAQRVPLALGGCALTLTLMQRRLMAQMEAIFETRRTHETDQLAEDGCMIRCDMHPDQKLALLARQCRFHDSPVEEVNHAICPDSFEEGTDVRVVILCGIVGRVLAGCRTDCVGHSWESEGQTQLDWLCQDVWEVRIFVK